MSDYQAVYDAVALNFSGASYMWPIIQQEACISFAELRRPSVLYRPALSIDGSKWCALYGDNLQDGVAGFGDTPAQAMEDFDTQWSKTR